MTVLRLRGRVVVVGVVAGGGEDLGEAAPVVVRKVGREVDVGRGVEVDGVVEAEDLDPTCQGFVPPFLLPAPVELLLIAAREVVVVVAGRGDPAGVGEEVDVDEAVGFDGLVVEPGAVARLPLKAADHAEFGAAAARHVVAAFLELDGRRAVEAALPSFLLGNLDKLLRRGVLGAFTARVPFVVTRAADFRLAPLAFAELPASVGATAGIDVNVRWFDPRAATP